MMAYMVSWGTFPLQNFGVIWPAGNTEVGLEVCSALTGRSGMRTHLFFSETFSRSSLPLVHRHRAAATTSAPASTPTLNPSMFRSHHHLPPVVFMVVFSSVVLGKLSFETPKPNHLFYLCFTFIIFHWVQNGEKKHFYADDYQIYIWVDSCTCSYFQLLWSVGSTNQLLL